MTYATPNRRRPGPVETAVRHALHRTWRFNRLAIVAMLLFFAVLTVKAQTATPLEKAVHRIELNLETSH